MALPAWIRHEPPDTTERAGLALVLLTGLGAALVASRLGIALRDERLTRRMVRSFTQDDRAEKTGGLSATILTVDYPLAALHGAWRPRLLLSRGLLAALEPDELEAVVEHERAHLAAHENLKRLLLRASPDPLALTAFGVRLRAAYEQAAEEAADEAACARIAPLAMAKALLKVASLVPPGHSQTLAMAALHREGTIEARVRALVARADAPAAASRLGDLKGAEPARLEPSPRLAGGRRRVRSVGPVRRAPGPRATRPSLLTRSRVA
jgi:hypothetical protein